MKKSIWEILEARAVGGQIPDEMLHADVATGPAQYQGKPIIPGPRGSNVAGYGSVEMSIHDWAIIIEILKSWHRDYPDNHRVEAIINMIYDQASKKG